MAYEVVSRPGDKKTKYEVVSKAAGAEPPTRQPGGTFMDHYRRAVGEATGTMGAGFDRMTAPGASMGGRALGAGQTALGALGYVASPFSAAMRRVVGNPAEYVAGAVGASPETQTQVGDIAGMAGEILGPAAAVKVGLNVPRAAQAVSEAMPLINRGATALGRVARGGVNTVDDLVKSSLEGAQRRGAAKTAEEQAIPTKDVLRTAGGGEFQAAKALGGDIKPEALQGRISDLRQRVTDQDVDLLAEQTYPNARNMIEYLERRAQDVSSFKELMGLQREARNFVKRAKTSGVTSGDDSDYRAAQIAMRDLDEFVSGLKAEDVVGGSPEAANEALRKGKELWARQAKMDVVEDVINKAKRMNDPDYLQKEFRKIALDDYEYGRFTDAEKKLIDEIAAEGLMDKVSDVATGTAAAVKRAAKLGGTSISPRIKKAEKLLKEIAKGQGDQEARAAAKASETPFSERVRGVMDKSPEDIAAEYRRRAENRNRGR